MININLLDGSDLEMLLQSILDRITKLETPKPKDTTSTPIERLEIVESQIIDLDEMKKDIERLQDDVSTLEDDKTDEDKVNDLINDAVDNLRIERN